MNEGRKTWYHFEQSITLQNNRPARAVRTSLPNALHDEVRVRTRGQGGSVLGKEEAEQVGVNPARQAHDNNDGVDRVTYVPPVITGGNLVRIDATY